MKQWKLYLSLLTLLIFFPTLGFATETNGQIQFYQEEVGNVETPTPNQVDAHPVKEPTKQPVKSGNDQRIAQLNDEVNLVLSVIGFIFLGFSIMGIMRRKLS